MLDLEHVTKIYSDGTKAVNDISFGVEEGELCVLLGPSGCGKTTTMKMINRLISMTEGKISLNGVDIMQTDENRLRQEIGYAIQEIGLFPHMTVGENIGVVPELKGWSKERRREQAKKLLQMVQMDPDDFIDKYPRELSGGQRQRVGVARSLGADPSVLLMDEPFGAIDPITRVQLQNEFLKIQQDIKKTIVFVTHDIYEAIKMGDKIALMNEGRIVQYATPFNVLFHPKDEFVADFVGTDRELKGLQLIRTKEVMQKSPPTAKRDEKVKTLLERVRRKKITHEIPVTDEKGRFAGWVDPAGLKGEEVHENLLPSKVTGSANTVLDEALSIMLGGRQRALAITDKDNKLQGLLTFSDIQRALGEVSKAREFA
jgi:osmoprotectant transport system ATP-binding protein